MAKIFITESADGLGQLTAKALITLGHEVVLMPAIQSGASRRWSKHPVRQMC